MLITGFWLLIGDISVFVTDVNRERRWKMQRTICKSCHIPFCAHASGASLRTFQSRFVLWTWLWILAPFPLSTSWVLSLSVFLRDSTQNQMLLICMSLNLTLCHKVLWFWSIFLLFAATGKHHTCVRCEGINWEAVLSVVSVNLRPACSRTGQSIAEKSSSLSAAIISL